jgi:murein DD-endopeptidase MepM/ murein hydrolase activator NlpD
MKPLKFLLPAVLATPAVVPLVSAIANDRSSGSLADDFLAGLTTAGDPSLTDPTASDPTLLAASPEQAASATPSAANQAASRSTVVRFGDTLATIAERYGLALSELLRVNPGAETARLVVGTRLRLPEPAPARARSLLAVKPLTSGGASWPELPDFGDRPSRPLAPSRPVATWIWPAKGVFTSGYGWRWGRMHKGIDVANNVGTPIVAAREGRVTYSGWHDGGYGYLVEITHQDGSRTLYGHNSRILVRTGEMVAQGQTISKMGSTGRSTGPHLHFEIHPPGRGAANPLQFLPPRA